ncbi:hypothetical protein [Streptomonospora salina]|uniref:Uncharacterized protein YbjT (DUF2867 family) n=1 Tax=Streptomonospora salina TaxID=104205 RepID=A0A841EB52_9ACTN|nr:hypothetical protein [Streptomonospora salina]MBB6000365.1 uncharacterized protein YbjT (DUF2867 family) [Streptomonospora salina]
MGDDDTTNGSARAGIGGLPLDRRAALAGERLLQNSGPAWTILRPWEFASNAL